MSRSTGPLGIILTGAGNFTVPEDVYALSPTLIGGGGGGGGVSTAAATATSGQPGVVQQFVVQVTPGQVIAYSCGAGTAGGAAGGNASDAADTTFGPFAGITLTAKGGKGGVGSTTGNAVSAATSSVQNTQRTAMAFAPLPGVFSIGTPTLFGQQAGTAGVGGQISDTPWAHNGAGGNNGIGSAGTGFGAAGGGAGSTGASSFAGGAGTNGAILL